MTDTHIDNRLDAYLDGELSETEAEALVSHAADCSRCREQLGAAEALRAQLVSLPVEGPESGFFEQAMAKAIAQPESKPMKRWASIAGGTLAAAMAVVAVIGMLNRTPDIANEIPGVTLALHETRTLNLVFSSADALDDARLVVELPDGLELNEYPGQQRVRWKTSLQAGRNVLPLDLVAVSGSGGEVIARLQQGDRSKVFRLRVDVTDGTSMLIERRPRPGQA